MTMASPRISPPAGVLAAFGLEGPAAALAGGQGTAWRVGDAVVKPLDMSPANLAWQQEMLARLDGRDDFRVSVPLLAEGGPLIVDGWTAWRFEPGEHRRGCWADIAGVGRRFHTAIRREPLPGFLRERDDRWAVADRVAWGELPPTRWAGVRPLDALFDALAPVAARSQLIHGDLGGNVLFHDDLPPLVIDVSPFWRPPVYATAIVVAGGLVYEGADADLLVPLGAEADFAQCLVRALIFRAVTECIATGGDDPTLDDRYRLAADITLRATEQARRS